MAFMHPASLISIDRMKRQLKKVVYTVSHKREKVFAFIDAQNIAKGIENSGWKIDWSAFRKWLAKHYNVSQAFMYIGYMAENRDLYLQLNNNGFNIDLKQTVKSAGRDASSRDSGDVKGNVDVDLTIGVWREYANYNKAIIISGDGDFVSLIQHLIDNKKLKKIIVPEFYSSLFRKYNDYIIELSDYREELKYVKNQNRQNGRSKRRGKPAAANAPSAKAPVRRRSRQDIKQRISVLNQADKGS